MTKEITVRHANYGIELVDALTGASLLGDSEIIVMGKEAQRFIVSGSRWIFEELAAGMTTFQITAENYVPRSITTGAPELPNDVPIDNLPGIVARIALNPRTGYPFPKTLTRVVGLVRIDPAVDASSPIVAGAEVTVTGRHVGGSTTDDPPVTTFTTEDGQYTMWFLPDPTADPPLVNQYLVTVEATVGGILMAGSLSAQALTAHTVSFAPTILIAPTP